MTDKVLKSTALKRGYGTLKELEEQVTAEDILHLQLGGYIENGISPDEGETFRVTKSGKNMLYFHSDKVSWKDMFMSLYMHYILGYKVAL